MIDRKLRVLVVDDEVVFSRSICRVLRATDRIDASAVESSAEACARVLSDLPPDVIISDLCRPISSGFDMLDELRGDGRYPWVPVIIISGSLCGDVRFGDEDMAYYNEREVKVWRHGADYVAAKPIQIDQLLKSIEWVIKRAGRYDLQGVDPDIVRLREGAESAALDYKEDLDISRAAVAAGLAKDVIAMSNTAAGGTIIVGVREASPNVFALVGISEARASELEVTKLNDKIRRYTGGVCVQARRFTHEGKVFVSVAVSPVVDTIVMSMADNQDAGLFQGRIYSRTDDARSAELREPLLVSRLFDRLAAHRAKAR
jgi:CheY-like chemotaxis protein